ncbi:MAG: acyltransferase [Flavihumibacter sp.]
MSLRDKIKNNQQLKRWVHRLLVGPNARPRLLTRWLVNPLVHRRSWKASISWSSRLDLLPNNQFSIGPHSFLESGTLVSNGVGDLLIGSNTLVGVGTVLIGPVTLGNNIIIAQHVVISGLNHVYADPRLPIREQPVTTAPIVIEDDCWIGANAVITAGVTIGRHSVVAGGAVVTKSIPAFSVVGGNPAKLLRVYQPGSQSWEKPI